jgi:type IV secretion system protein VirB6
MFFNGTLGSFAANSSFGNVGRNSTGQQSDFTQGVTKEGKRGNRAGEV